MDREGTVVVSNYWKLSHRADQETRKIADRHYNRQKPGTPQFVPPGRCLVLKRKDGFWVTSWPFAEYVKHDWPGAFICSAFRNEGSVLSSVLIRDAIACTIWKYPEIPKEGMITFINADKVRKKRDPGRCFLRAGFTNVGKTKGGLVAVQLLPTDFPEPSTPKNTPGNLFLEAIQKKVGIEA